VGERPNDGVVPERSALGKSSAGVVVPPLQKGVPSSRPFNHLDVGKDSQPISAFSNDDIFPRLADHTVSTITAFSATCPTLTTGGSASATVQVNFNVPHGELTQVAAVLYVQDGTGRWRIEDGANPSTRLPTRPLPISGNSIDRDPLTLRLPVSTAFPPKDPTDPRTLIQRVAVLAFPLGPTLPPTVPADPTTLEFGLPGAGPGGACP